ncbi:universal stress protein [Streptomyces litchfieldiae]|uniref:Universal stress protein n=1 Tax=Streptomyces litchfieldiae TaxID=3075543 RepID=A0ABU2MU99_9ACTN|nr:universal stress protein [Streptomyces sp. DSM 44938]MDT0345228.1 universal stress protein [Streptomyces sp. DSM 44938]
MTRPITAGVDGSPEARAAADWAAVEAERRGLPLRLVHAWITEPIFVPPMPDEEAARALLDETSDALAATHPGLTITTEMVPEVATTGLINKAADSEMLVLGSRGHSAIVGFLLGSVGLPVIAHTRRPVVMVRSGTRERADEGDEVVVAIKDAGPAAQPLLDFAFTAAVARGATVRAVRAWGTPSLFGAEVPGSVEENAAAAVDLEAVESGVLTDVLMPWRERYPDVPVVEQARFGNAAEVLLSAAAFRAGLVVVGRRLHRPVLGMRVGPVVHAALHHARSPVAVVPYDNEQEGPGEE